MNPRELFVIMVWSTLAGSWTDPDMLRRRDRQHLVLDLLFSGIARQKLAGSSTIDKAVLEYAVALLENLFSEKADAPIALRAHHCDLLAACGRFDESARVAEQYTALLWRQCWDLLAPVGFVPVPDDGTYESYAAEYYVGECMAASGRMEEAIQRLEKAASLRPNIPLTHHRLAELYAHEQKYIEACKHLAIERDLAPDADTWKDPIADIASTVFREIEMHGSIVEHIKEEYEKRSILSKNVLYGAIKAHWAVFEWLDVETQKHWINGCFWLFGDHRHTEWSSEERATYATQSFALAVEVELRSRVFLPFKAEKGAELVEAAHKVRDKRLQQMALFLLGDYNPNLGTMFNAIQMAVQGAQEKITATLHEFLAARVGRGLQLVQSGKKYGRLVETRNLVVHGGRVDSVTAHEMLYLCQEFLSVFRGAAQKARVHPRD
jgi:hypothetical protein